MIARALIILLALGMTACTKGSGSGGGGGGSCSALNVRIFNGDTCDQSARSPVVAIIPVAVDGSELAVAGICSGVLVTVDDIATSAHCFVSPAAQLGSRLAGFVALVGGADGDVLSIANVAIHPQYNGSVGSRFDFAMATLSAVPDPAIGPVPVLFGRSTEVGTKVSAFGYGTNNEGEVGVLKAAEFRIDAIRAGNLLVAAELGGNGASICPGDSGGPAISVVDGVSSLVGINSFGEFGGCVSTATRVFGLVDIQSQLIVDFMTGYAPDITVR